MDKDLGITRQETNTDNKEVPSKKHKRANACRAESMFVSCRPQNSET